MNVIELIRAVVRPYIALATITVILGMAIFLVVKFASPDMAKLVMTFVLATSATVIGFYFGERKAGK